MKVIISQAGSAATSPDAFRTEESAQPKAQGRDLLIKIAATGMNPVDTKVRTRMEQDTVLGWDAVGSVEETGSEVSNFSVGDRVFYAGDLTRPGTNSEYQLVDERLVALAPKTLDDAHAAAMPLTSITAWEALFTRLQFTPAKGANTGKSILIIGGAGGVGSIATQLAHWAGLTVFSTASRPDTIDWVKERGADFILNHRHNLAEELRATGTEHVDAIFCTTQMERHWNAMAECIAPQGKIAFIDDPENPLDLTVFKPKSVSLHWEFMYTRSMFQTADMHKQGELLSNVAQLLDEKELRSTCRLTYSGLNAENIRKMHIEQESGKMIGKQVLVF
ncbi:zinc-binding alcohol dehydrogenase family protein [Desulfobaculum bizertense]|uniref:zinc-binding alcohol dehydrogenase family protein n=1 Tax=Desulfobaculum bizertense TaxID=376490 RepID=UPI001F4104CE|nr:zinc-binding alcohol dehydrogenase family protein [Desulfobaculum bizertense]UIJ37789.1 zinc-binding alcohol dehydrogenase family protein [Desulfobaculum bizertense]